MNIQILSANSPKWLNQEHTLIELNVEFAHCGTVSFTASQNDIEPHGVELFNRAVTGEFGTISEYTPPTLSTEQIIQNLTSLVNKKLNDFAKERGYDNILSACTYTSSSVQKYQVEGQYCIVARDITWQTFYSILSDVNSNLRTLPSEQQLLSELPQLIWPN